MCGNKVTHHVMCGVFDQSKQLGRHRLARVRRRQLRHLPAALGALPDPPVLRCCLLSPGRRLLTPLQLEVLEGGKEGPGCVDGCEPGRRWQGTGFLLEHGSAKSGLAAWAEGSFHAVSGC